MDFVKLELEYYRNDKVLRIARGLLGKELVTKSGSTVTSGIIVETEAYNGIGDRASHAYGGRLTDRTKVMYRPGGCAYVYLCYGIHHLFNVVTGKEGNPQAVLIRGVIPEKGKSVILKRRNAKKVVPGLCIGPGKVSQGLGIRIEDTSFSLIGSRIWIEDIGLRFRNKEITKSPRVGVNYAGADALLPWRFRLKL